ncbi:MAG: hypothetical protein VX910_12505 [Candidatus Latescibacterota bacterium]|nr:hypothetical protein [Candidatus Latescibacterota bacterium]
MGGLDMVGVWVILFVSVVSGFYTSLWGAFKDSPYEGFKPKTFPRSVYFHVVIFIVLYFLNPFAESFRLLKLFQVFFLVMGLERFLAEIYKGFFRTEDQSKYFVPSRITFLGKHVASDLARYVVGALLVAGVCAVALIPTPVTEFWVFLAVAYAAGLLVSLGGAYKDAPFEGFKWLKFQRSSVVLAVASPLFYFTNETETPVSLGFLIYMNGGLERFLVEYYKTYIQRNMSGKFRPDLERIQVHIDNREKFHYLTWVIIVGLIALYVYEL